MHIYSMKNRAQRFRLFTCLSTVRNTVADQFGSECTVLYTVFCLFIHLPLFCGGRFSAPRKAQAVRHLPRGEDLELLSRELDVIASTPSLWPEQFLAAGQLAVKGKTGKTDIRDEQISRLNKRVGELTMDIPIFVD